MSFMWMVMLRLRWPARSYMDSLPELLARPRPTCSFSLGNTHGILHSAFLHWMPCSGIARRSKELDLRSRSTESANWISGAGETTDGMINHPFRGYRLLIH